MYLVPGVALLLGIAIGQISGESSSEKEETDSSGHRVGSKRFTDRMQRESPGAGTEFQRLRSEINRASPDKIPALVYRILEISDHNERKIALFEAIRAADPDQCKAIMDQFGGITRDTGRVQHDIWRSALFETGKIGGAEMLDSWRAQGKTGGHTELQEALYGFASRDPQGALDWLQREENADLQQHENLLGFAIAGAALTDMTEAARMMGELAPEQRRANIGHFMWNAIQNEGIDNVLDWVITERQQAMDTDPAYVQALENDVFGRLFSSAEWTGGAPLMAERFARIHQKSPISSERLIYNANRLHGGDGLVFIDGLTRNQVIAADDPGVTVRFVNQFAANSPFIAQKWLQENPGSPIHDLVESALGSAP